MLKIRGKLVLSFSIVMVILLSALGSITYFTFKDSIGYSKKHIFELSLKNHNLSFENILGSLRLDIHTMIDGIQFENDILDTVNLALTLSKQQKSNELIQSIAAFDSNKTQLYGDNTLSTRLVKSIFFENPTASPTKLYAVNNEVWMSSDLHLNINNIRLFYLLDINKIWQIVLNNNNREPDSLIFVSSGTEVLLSHIEQPLNPDKEFNVSKSELLNDPSKLSSMVHTLSSTEEELILIDDHYGTASNLGIMDWRIYSVLSTDDYLADIIKLKNRVIAATLVTLWFSIWIVLIVAHKIAKPISLLAAAALSIQNSGYSTPLIFSRRKDEIGDLASSFEKMRKHIESLIFTDTLTGIFNRRYLVRMMEHAIPRSIREDLPLTFMMIDLDHFKAVNDTYGHGAGDEVLKAASSALVKAVRNYDIPARYGGEEFCVILPSTDIQDAVIVADRIRHEIESLVIHRDGHELTVTCSLGIAELHTVEDYKNSSKEDVMNTLMSNADTALYISKDSGRNRSTVYCPDQINTGLLHRQA